MRVPIIALLLANALLLAILVMGDGGEGQKKKSASSIGSLKALSAEEESAAREAESKKPGCLRFGPFPSDLTGEGLRLAEAEWPGKKKVWSASEEGMAWILVDAKAKKKGFKDKESFGALVKGCSTDDQKTLRKDGPL